MFDTYIGTESGVYQVNGKAESLGLSDQRISGIYAFHNSAGDLVILAGSYGNGLFRSTDGGKSWQPITDREGMSAPAARTIGPDPLNHGMIICGTEPGRIFRSSDDGKSWRELDGILAVPGYQEWYLPYSPRAGAVRNVYAPPGSQGQLFASVEVGGLLRSDDNGLSWSIAAIGPNDDIHQIYGDPSDPNLLWGSLGYAALKSRNRDESSPKLGGVGRSRDGGQSWDVLHTDYTRSTIVPPSHPDLVLAGPAPYVGREGRIEVSKDKGESWEPAGNGIETPMPDMVELFVVAPDESIYAVCSGGRLLRSAPGDWNWQSALPKGQPDNVVSVSFVEG